MSIQIKSLLTTMGAALVLALVVPIASAIGHSAAPASGLEFTSPPAESSAAAKLREDMRKLWTDHVIWTREYIVAAIDGTPDVNAAATRLMKNQDDIGAAVATFYGNAAGTALTVLLKEHISIAVDVVAAAKANDHGKYNAADRRWKKNGNDIAKFLSKANPHWPEAVLVDMMNMHLATTTKEVVARLNKNWDADVQAFDEVYLHILRMSDALAEGIVKQFPESVLTAKSPSLFIGNRERKVTAVAKQSITVRRTESLTDDLDRLHDLIRRRAYEIFLGRDRRAGSDFDDWLLAEQELVLRPAIELRQRDGRIELDAVVTSGDPTDLDVRVGPQDILISSSTSSSRETQEAGVHIDEIGARMLFGSVHLPTRIDPTTVEAEWRDGLLHLTAAVAKQAATGSETRSRSEA